VNIVSIALNIMLCLPIFIFEVTLEIIILQIRIKSKKKCQNIIKTADHIIDSFPNLTSLNPGAMTHGLLFLRSKNNLPVNLLSISCVRWNRMHKWMCISLTLGNLTLAVWVLPFFMPTHRYYLRTGLLKSFVNIINLLSAIEPKHE
jgi:hypothetical protein